MTGFERDWIRLGMDNGGKVDYLRQIGLEKLPKIFRESLTSELIADLFTLAADFGDKQLAADMLRSMPKYNNQNLRKS